MSTNLSAPEIRLCPPSLARRWDRYVLAHPRATSYHMYGWLEVLGEFLGHRSIALSAWRGETLCGVLPLVDLSRPLLGRILVSLPFVNYGGVLADDQETARALTDAAIAEAQRVGAKSLELRHLQSDTIALPARSHRVRLSLALPSSVETLWKSFDSSLRSQVRKASKNGLLVRSGGIEHLDAFYSVFSANMRDLGSPVWPRRFFKHILLRFPERTRLYRVDLGSRTLAGGFILRFRQEVEIPWASSLRSYNRLCGNMALYWQILADATRAGYTRFDFGRSEPGAGTYKFKLSWGAQPSELHWHYWPDSQEAEGGLEAHRERLEQVWQKLPIWSTWLLGPPVRRLLPQ